MADKVGYGGNPEHKKHPNDYGLTPPTNPRPGKTLCDGDGPFPIEKALAALRTGMKRGMFSLRGTAEWPSNVWAAVDGICLEAQLENVTKGTYHGYPMPKK